ncbi:MAG TPA: glucosamine-6-phosphate deaminase [Burkholderiales bacterium]|nr:glucosamine-6-phosphate deaminase [Burkholderiales bacterium]
MRLLISKHNLGKWAAYYVYKKITEFKPTESNPFVLGLPTGSTPFDMYKELINLYKKKLISFKNVVTFNMDDYVGLPDDHPQSFKNYMHSHFFKHVDINPKNIHMLNGNATYLDYECKVFEENIETLGGIHLLIGGIGEDGHIAFNEPGSSLSSRTRVKTLNYSTVLANSRFFEHSIENTPTVVLTMGIQTILECQEIVILAKGLNKSNAVAQAIEGGISSLCPATSLQFHKKALMLCDEYAAYNLKLKTIRYFENLNDEYIALDNEIITEGFTE